MGGVGGEGAANDSDLPELKEARADQMVDMGGQRHHTVDKDAEVSDGLDSFLNILFRWFYYKIGYIYPSLQGVARRCFDTFVTDCQCWTALAG